MFSRSSWPFRRLAVSAVSLFVLLATSFQALAADFSSTGIFQWRPFLAPFHSVVLHLPIGFVTIAFALELLVMRRPGQELRRAISLVLSLSVLSSFLTITFGLLRSDAGEYDIRTLDLHKWYGIAVGLITIVVWALHWLASRPAGSRWPLPLYRLLLVGDLTVLVIAGHYGGNLTHGSDYLVKNAPEFVKELIEEASEDNIAAASSLPDLFTQTVKPIFENKCQSCHGAEKKKGGYRLDDVGLALKPGESEEAPIVPGDPFKSHLVKLILLPPDDDSVMPPSGKGTLTSDEIMSIIRWIQAGAHFSATQAEMPAPVAR